MANFRVHALFLRPSKTEPPKTNVQANVWTERNDKINKILIIETILFQILKIEIKIYFLFMMLIKRLCGKSNWGPLYRIIVKELSEIGGANVILSYKNVKKQIKISEKNFFLTFPFISSIIISLLDIILLLYEVNYFLMRHAGVKWGSKAILIVLMIIRIN